MFSFFEEISQFLNYYYDNYLFPATDEVRYYLRIIVEAALAILEFIREIAYSPLGLGWLYPVLLVTLFFEWRARHKGKGL